MLTTFDQQRCWELYQKFPGLTCEAIAYQLQMKPSDVRRILGYSPAGQEKISPQPSMLVRMHNYVCPSCGSRNRRTAGKNSLGRQVFRCSVCDRRYADSYERTMVLIEKTA